MITKTCNVCHNVKSLELFPKCHTCKDGHNNYCQSCKSKKTYNIEWSKTHKEYKRKWNVLHRYRYYNLSNEEYTSMKLKQNGHCLICDKKHDKLNIDHCHANGKVRGLLCSNCNKGLGFFQEDINLLLKAITYLKNNSPTLFVGELSD